MQEAVRLLDLQNYCVHIDYIYICDLIVVQCPGRSFDGHGHHGALYLVSLSMVLECPGPSETLCSVQIDPAEQRAHCMREQLHAFYAHHYAAGCCDWNGNPNLYRMMQFY
jgi:hypothetical protein